MEAAFRRRLLIEPADGQVTAELEDDWHRMLVTLHHRDGVITDVASCMKRAPWTTCPGAVQRLADTFVGADLADAGRRGEKPSNCTHLHDLAVVAAAHAGDRCVTAYDITVTDPHDGDGRRSARLWRDGALVLDWRIEGVQIVAPVVLAGCRLTKMGDWIAGLDRPGQEAARLLRWAAIMCQGRQMHIADGSSAGQFATGACFTFQPEPASRAVRVPDAHHDLWTPGRAPLADRAAWFPALQVDAA